MSDDASVIIDKAPLDSALAAALMRLKSSRARSHGNYLPALDKALEILQADTPNCENKVGDEVWGALKSRALDGRRGRKRAREGDEGE